MLNIFHIANDVPVFLFSHFLFLTVLHLQYKNWDYFNDVYHDPCSFCVNCDYFYLLIFFFFGLLSYMSNTRHCMGLPWQVMSTFHDKLVIGSAFLV